MSTFERFLSDIRDNTQVDINDYTFESLNEDQFIRLCDAITKTTTLKELLLVPFNFSKQQIDLILNVLRENKSIIFLSLEGDVDHQLLSEILKLPPNERGQTHTGTVPITDASTSQQESAPGPSHSGRVPLLTERVVSLETNSRRNSARLDKVEEVQAEQGEALQTEKERRAHDHFAIDENRLAIEQNKLAIEENKNAIEALETVSPEILNYITKKYESDVEHQRFHSFLERSRSARIFFNIVSSTLDRTLLATHAFASGLLKGKTKQARDAIPDIVLILIALGLIIHGGPPGMVIGGGIGFYEVKKAFKDAYYAKHILEFVEEIIGFVTPDPLKKAYKKLTYYPNKLKNNTVGLSKPDP